jgi:hypothetical protein
MALASAARAAEWQPLFNGKDLSGWHQSGEERWRVEQGTIVGETAKGGYGWLVTDRQYADFVLRLRFKLEGKGNSGVQFRSWLEGTKMHGYQADIEPVEKDRTGSFYDEHDMQWLKRTTPDPERVLNLNGWNDFEVSAIGDHLQVWLNGVLANDLRHGRTRTGVIALQVHPAIPDAPVKVRWKDLRILDLTPPKLHHAVYLWANPDVTEAERAAYVKDCWELLGAIPSVRSLRVQTPAGPSEGRVDNSYTYALILGFDSLEGLRQYEADPRHQELSRRHGKMWKTVRIHNSTD